MRLVRTLVVTSFAAVVLALAATPAGAQSAPTLTDVRAGGHTGFDRVVFEFDGAVPEHRVGYVDQLVQDGSPTISPRRFSTGLTAVKEVVQAGDFEAVVTYGIGVDRKRPIKVSTLSNPSRLVIDVSTAGSGGSSGTGGELPFTGSHSTGLLVTALALLATGAAVLALARRTRIA